MGHGDTQQVILLPGSVNECFEFGWRAFDLAERLQTPVIVLSDLDLGMNQWMAKPFEYPDVPMDRGKVLWEEDLEKWEQLGKRFSRYLDIDGDGIPYRTVPGNRHPRSAYFTRGSGHDEYAQYSERPEVLERLLKRLKRKYETARGMIPKPIIETMEGAEIGIIAFGSTDPAIQEARHHLEQRGIKSDYLRLRGIPFPSEVGDFVRRHDRNFVVELNRDGQLHQLLTIEYAERATSFISVARIDGLPATAKWIEEAIV
jgi:2-oxoglutarate ferredoxin oxidoreductase subunit alpha